MSPIRAPSRQELQKAVVRKWMASTLTTLSPTAISTTCRRALRSTSRTKPRLNHRLVQPHQMANPGAPLREPIPPVHFAAGRDRSADGCNPPGWNCWLHTTAGFRVAASRLSDNSGRHVLSGSQPDCDVDHRNGATGAPVRATARFEPDDLHQLRRHLRYRFAI